MLTGAQIVAVCQELGVRSPKDPGQIMSALDTIDNGSELRDMSLMDMYKTLTFGDMMTLLLALIPAQVEEAGEKEAPDDLVQS